MFLCPNCGVFWFVYCLRALNFVTGFPIARPEGFLLLTVLNHQNHLLTVFNIFQSKASSGVLWLTNCARKKDGTISNSKYVKYYSGRACNRQQLRFFG